MKNIEYKAELRDPRIARAACPKAGATHIGVLEQIDTYFRVASGRLKRRVATLIEAGTGGDTMHPEQTEYIAYHRPDDLQPKVSDFAIYTEDEARERYGTSAMHVLVEVTKRRELWLCPHARIHLDHVDRLGWFVEFECLIRDGHTEHNARAEMARLRHAFGPCLGEPISVSYADLMLQTDQHPDELPGEPTGEREA